MFTCRYTHTRLLVANYKAAFAFYRNVLGLTPKFGDEAGPYAEFETGPCALAIFDRTQMDQALGQTTPAGSSTEARTVVLCLAVENVDKVYELLKGKGVTFVTPPTDRPAWMIRTVHLRDPDGNLIEINARLGK